MYELGIDIETYSSNNLPDCGVYKYVEAPDFTILLFAYSVDRGPVQVVDLAQGETLPEAVKSALTDASVVKTAYNAAFERICISKWLGIDGFLDPAQWRCTMVRAARMGLPLGLGACGEVLGLVHRRLVVVEAEPFHAVEILGRVSGTFLMMTGSAGKHSNLTTSATWR